MKGTMMYGPRDVRFEERPDPTIIEPTDAIIRLSATCVCGSDLWPYRGIDPVTQPMPMGHEYAASSRRSAARSSTSSPASSSSARSSPRTTPARSAGPATRRPASTGSPARPPVRRRSTPASRSPTAPWSQRRTCRRQT